MHVLDSNEIIHRTKGKVMATTNGEDEEEDHGIDIDDAYDMARTRNLESYNDAITSKDINTVHVIWNKMVEVALLVANDTPIEQAIASVEDAPLRGAPPEFK